MVTHSRPDPDRLSVLAAVILLGYILGRFVTLPVREVTLQLPGLFLSIQLGVNLLITILTASLTAVGMAWLVQSHPALAGRSSLPFCLLPALSAWVFGIPLSLLPFGYLWVGSFIAAGLLLILVMVAEYIAVDPDDVRYPPAAAGLTAVSFALFLILAIVLRSAQVRLLWILPALALSAGLVSLRTLYLRSPVAWQVLPSLAVSMIIAHLTAALQYWPISPIAFGMAVFGPAYALTTFISRLNEADSWRAALLEPGIVLLFSWGLMLWIR